MSKHDWENDKNFLELLEHIRSGRPFTKDDLKESKPKETKKVVIKSCYKPFKANNYELVKNFNAKNDEELKEFVKLTLKKKFKYEHEKLLGYDTDYVMSMLKYEELKENKAVGMLINAVLEKMAERQYKIINIGTSSIMLHHPESSYMKSVYDSIYYYEFNLKDIPGNNSYINRAMIKLLSKKIKSRFNLTYNTYLSANAYGNKRYWIERKFNSNADDYDDGLHFYGGFTVNSENIIDEIHDIEKRYFYIGPDDRPGHYGKSMVNYVTIRGGSMRFDGEIDDGKVSW